MIILTLILSVFCSTAAVGQELISSHLMLPVEIKSQAITLESFVIRPNRQGRFPVVLMTHGMRSIPGDSFFGEVLNRSPVTYMKAILAFAQRGYAVVTFMRRGYGRSEGGFSERLGRPCDYTPAVRGSSEDVAAAAASILREPWADFDHVLLVGHSVGGLSVLAAASKHIPGVVGVLNFDGGWHSFAAPNEPCSPDRLVNTLAELGRAARVPALWLYAENDRSYGPDLARRMFEAYVAGGAPAEFHLLPPFGEDGHDTITRAPADSWFPAAEPFLRQLSLPVVTSEELLFAALPPPPNASDECRKAFAEYVANPDDAKAFAVSSGGGCGAGFARTRIEAHQPALTKCKIFTRGGDCKLYADGQQLAQQ